MPNAGATSNTLWYGILMLCSTLTILASAPIAPSAPAMAENFNELKLAVFWVQLAIAMPGLSIALSSVFLPHLIKRYPPVNMLLVALIAYSILGLAYLAAPASLVLLLLSRMLLGLCVATIMIIATVLLTQHATTVQSQRRLGWQAAVGGFAAVIYMTIASGLIHFHWQAPFSLYGLGLIFALALLVVKVPSQLNAPPKFTSSSATSKPAGDEALPHKRVSGYLLATLASMEMIALYALVLQVPFTGIASLSILGIALAISLLCMAVVAANYSHLRKLMSPRQQHALGSSILAVVFATLALSDNANGVLLPFMLLLAIAGAALGLLRPNLVAWWLSQTEPQLRAQTMGKITAIFFAAQFAAPFLIYPLTRVSVNQGLWWFMAIFCSLCVLLLFRTDETK